MSADQCLCVALFAPGSVDAEVGRLQARIFGEQGLASAHAVPPLVPIGFVRDGRDLLASVEGSVAAPWRASAGTLRWHEGSLFLGIESGALWARAREALQGLGQLAEPGFFPCAEGFFLGCGDATDAQRDSIRGEAPRISFSSATISLVRFTSPFGAGGYWRELYWETLEERPFRGRRVR